MSDLIKIFDGTLIVGKGATLDSQNASSFSEISTENEAIDIISSGSQAVDFRVDYSDFSNFVTFNSAESYVTITADKILNEYPFGGSTAERETFINSLDGYQRYFLSRWPSNIGHLRFNPAVASSYISFTDAGVVDGVAKTSLISPGTGSLSICFWIDVPILTGSNTVMPVFQKITTTNDGATVYVTGSEMRFRLVSGSTSAEVSASLSQMPMFVSSIFDRDSSQISILTATSGTFPVINDRKSFIAGTRFDLGSGSFSIASGALSSKVTVSFTGNLDDVSVWSSTRGLAQLTSSYNRKIFSQSSLIAGWRFNECISSTSTPTATVVRDCSGHRLDGRIQSHFSQIRSSGSFAFDYPDPILTLDESSVVDYIVDAQSSGSDYDRSNDSLIFNLFPSSFLLTDDAGAFTTIALTIARQFDAIKVAIDQLVNTMKVGYDDVDDVPDSLLTELAAFVGWKDSGGFNDVDALKFFIGRGIRAGSLGNYDQGITLQDIKNEFLRRALQNSMYVFKSKGTRESIESIMRIRGVDSNLFRFKEYARRVESRMLTERVVTEKSVYAAQFVSGSSIYVGSTGSTVAPSAQSFSRMVAIFGYSNDIGLEVAANVTVYPGLTAAYPAVTQYDRIAFSAGDPPTFVDDGPRSLAPRATGHGVSYPSGSGGIELSMMRDLDTSLSNDTWYVIKMGIDSASMISQWDNAAYPTAGPPILTQLITFIQDRATAFGITDLAENLIVVSLNGAVDTGQAYATYLAALQDVFGTMRTSLGNFRIAFERLTTQIDSARNVIAAQEAFVANDSGRSLWVHADDLALRGPSDNHYADDSYATLGVRLASAIADNINGVAKTNPYYVAAGPVTVANSAQSVTVTIPPHEADDIILIILSSSGQNTYALTANAGTFVAVSGSPVHDSGAAVNARLQVWWARASAAGTTAPTIGDVASDGSKGGIAVVIRGAYNAGNPFDTTATSNDTTAGQTAVSMPGVVTSIANCLILNIVAAIVDQADPQLSQATNADLTDLVSEVNYNSSSGSGVTIGVYSGRKVAAGSVSATTATLTNGGRQACMTLAIRP